MRQVWRQTFEASPKQGMLFAFFEHVAWESVALEGHSHVTPCIKGDNRMPEMQRLELVGAARQALANIHEAADGHGNRRWSM